MLFDVLACCFLLYILTIHTVPLFRLELYHYAVFNNLKENKQLYISSCVLETKSSKSAYWGIQHENQTFMPFFGTPRPGLFPLGMDILTPKSLFYVSPIVRPTFYCWLHHCSQ